MVVAYSGVALLPTAHALLCGWQAAPDEPKISTVASSKAEADSLESRPTKSNSSNTSRHQPLYRDQSVSKRQDNTVSGGIAC